MTTINSLPPLQHDSSNHDTHDDPAFLTLCGIVSSLSLFLSYNGSSHLLNSTANPSSPKPLDISSREGPHHSTSNQSTDPCLNHSGPSLPTLPSVLPGTPTASKTCSCNNYILWFALYQHVPAHNINAYHLHYTEATLYSPPLCPR